MFEQRMLQGKQTRLSRAKGRHFSLCVVLKGVCNLYNGRKEVGSHGLIQDKLFSKRASERKGSDTGESG